MKIWDIPIMGPLGNLETKKVLYINWTFKAILWRGRLGVFVCGLWTILNLGPHCLFQDRKDMKQQDIGWWCFCLSNRMSLSSPLRKVLKVQSLEKPNVVLINVFRMNYGWIPCFTFTLELILYESEYYHGLIPCFTFTWELILYESQ